MRMEQSIWTLMCTVLFLQSYDEDLDNQGHKFIIKPVTILTICGLSFSLLFSLLLSSLFAAAISFQTTNGQKLEC